LLASFDFGGLALRSASLSRRAE